LNSRNIVANTAEAFLWYVSNIIQDAIRRKPQLMISSETMKIEDIFNYSNRRELVNYLIDRKINSLSYGGLRQIEKYLSETLGIVLFQDPFTKNMLRIFIEVRNIHAHNRGYVNKVFLDRVGECLDGLDFRLEEGKKAHLDYDALCMFSRVCVETAMHLDKEVSQKFKIDKKRLSTWLVKK
jgi:hypothetical protein